jgi:type IV pilus assembly protein PilQ
MKKRIFAFILCLGLGLIFIGTIGASEINIDASSPFIYPDYSKRISMDFQNAALVDVLKIFSQQSNLNLITSAEIADKRVTVFLDQVPVEQALTQLLRANNLTYELQPDTDIYVVKPLTKLDTELITRVYPLKHATVNASKLKQTLQISTGDGASIKETADKETIGIIAAIKSVLTTKGKIMEDPRTNSLIVTDLASNFPNIEQTIARLDVPVSQILIEVEMLEVSKGTADLIGVKIGSTPLTFTGGQRDHVYPWNQNRLLDKGFTFEDPEYRVGTIDASGFSAVLQFLRTKTDTKNLARPRILTLNNEPAQIKISTDEAIGAKTSTSSSQNIATSSVEAERVKTGVFLTVTPQANLLTGEIIMAVVPKVIITRTGLTFQGATFKDPEERGSQSILRVQTGDTIILGGLIRSDTQNIITKVPILGDLPLIGSAFRHKNETISDRELIIFITPHIINETPLPKTAAFTEQRPLVREQDVPVPDTQPGAKQNNASLPKKAKQKK